MKLTFEHKGRSYQLVKHPNVLKELRDEARTVASVKLTAWYFRPPWDSGKRYKLAVEDGDAIADAKDILRGREKDPVAFVAWVASQKIKTSITIGELSEQWITAGLPFGKTEPRSANAAEQLKKTITRAVTWWKDKPAAGIKRTHHDDYVVHRRANNKRSKTSETAGSRSADLELSALSSLCQWAHREGLIDANPFAERTRYQDAKDVQHCHQFRPNTDEELHRILRWFFTFDKPQEEIGNRHRAAHVALQHRLAGGWLAFTALTGLRPEEPAFILRGETLTQPPAQPAKLPPGTIFPDRDGKLRMKVIRTKHGQNPYVDIHPVLAAFLKTWNAWLDAQREFNPVVPTPPDGKPVTVVRHLFPALDDPSQSVCPVTIDAASGKVEVDTTTINKKLKVCCKLLKLDVRKPKGMGRAYYVAVRRSAGADDATIAGELGQTTNGELIRTTYGDPDDLRGGKLRDWVPEAPQQFAWTALADTQEQQNIVTVKFAP